METIEQRLEKVFATVFPDMKPAHRRQASQGTVPAWDSIASITLINVIEEEFEIELDFDQVGELTSFASIADYLRGKLAQTAA